MTILAVALNQFVMPICIVLLPVFIQYGCTFIGSSSDEMGCRFGNDIIDQIRSAPVETLIKYIQCFLIAIGVWCAITPFIVTGLNCGVRAICGMPRRLPNGEDLQEMLPASPR